MLSKSTKKDIFVFENINICFPNQPSMNPGFLSLFCLIGYHYAPGTMALNKPIAIQSIMSIKVATCKAFYTEQILKPTFDPQSLSFLALNLPSGLKGKRNVERKSESETMLTFNSVPTTSRVSAKTRGNIFIITMILITNIRKL